MTNDWGSFDRILPFNLESKMRTKTRLRSHRWLVFMMNLYLPQHLRCERALPATCLVEVLVLLERSSLLAVLPTVLLVVRQSFEHAI